ncbi:MAG TPA: lysophospholipid acyltransferase family protein [Paludibacter sp.]|nr:lysophospholipid acyltransferase family protein [Paludibacter sp.]
MQKIISFPLSVIAGFMFFFLLTIFHPIQFVCLRLFGYEAHKRSVDILNFFLLGIVFILFSYPKAEFRAKLPEGKPLILVANHQSIFDIMLIGWFLRKYHPKYVSKIELGRNIPSVSFNLKHGGSVLIDRKDPKQALPALKQMGEYIQQHNRSTVIYPEGTRSHNGKPGAFAQNGLKILCKYAPDALVVPLTINNSWKMFRYGGFPFGLGNRLQLIVHEPMPVRGSEFNSLFEYTEKTVVDAIVQPQK